MKDLERRLNAAMQQGLDDAVKRMQNPAFFTGLARAIPQDHIVNIDPDEICQACGRLLSAHGINIEFNMADAVPASNGGYAHKVCALEEAEIVEVKSLPPSTGESHGEKITPATASEA